MFPTSLQNGFWAITFILLQVMVFNHIHIMGYATPMPFVYLLLMLHSHTERWIYVVWGFAVGLIVDVFSNTLGVCAAAMTFLGLVAPLLRDAFMPADRGEDGITPSPRSMQWSGYLRYAATTTILFTSVFYVMECFSFFDVVRLLIHIATSSALTLLIICSIEHIRQNVVRG